MKAIKNNPALLLIKTGRTLGFGLFSVMVILHEIKKLNNLSTNGRLLK
jgi:hypothetical protein